MTNETKTQAAGEKQTAERIRAIDIVASKKRSHRTREIEAGKSTGGTIELSFRNFFGGKFPGMLALAEGVRRQFRPIAAQGNVPAYDHVKHMNVDIHLRDGLKPNEKGEIHALLEVKVREIKPQSGDGKINYYLYINAFPLPEGQTAKKIVTLAQYCRDETAYEVVFVPNGDQQIQQATICVAALPPA